jgi:hypothetical protein
LRLRKRKRVAFCLGTVGFNTDFAIECTHKYSMHFRKVLSIKLIAAMELFFNRSVKNPDFAFKLNKNLIR